MQTARLPRADTSAHAERDVDILIVGAGVSGIGAACRLRLGCPDKRYAILEARGAIGGTWDLFRYPGVRSDSDVQSFGYPFRPWQGTEVLASGPAIRQYVEDTAREFGVDARIHYERKVVAASWSSETARWTVQVMGPHDGPESWTCSFLLSCTGYFDYDRGHAPQFGGIDDFQGTVVHPQFWPDDLDLAGRRVVVIGSGATAVTLVPALAGTAHHVTMLQRSPSYLISLPRQDAVAARLNRLLPARTAFRAVRTKNITAGLGFYLFARRFPARARSLLAGPIAQRLGEPALVEHFTPRYDVWDQRLCVIQDGDLLDAINRGDASVVTDHVDRFVPEGIRLRSGRVLEADVVITATGLTVKGLGGMALTVDGHEVSVPEQLMYRGLMLSGVPNLALLVGYANAAWTLRTDLASRYVCRYLKHLDTHGLAYGVPVPAAQQERRPLIPLTSGYLARGLAQLPSQGTSPPWTFPQNYFADRRGMRRADVTEDMRFVSWSELLPDRTRPAAPIPGGET